MTERKDKVTALTATWKFSKEGEGFLYDSKPYIRESAKLNQSLLVPVHFDVFNS